MSQSIIPVIPENLLPQMEIWVPLYPGSFVVVHRTLLDAETVLPALRNTEITRPNLWSISTKVPLRQELHNLLATSAAGLQLSEFDLTLMGILHLINFGGAR